MRGLLVAVLALGVTACAQNRVLCETPAGVTACRPASGPERAQDLARRLAVGYEDQDSHVLLTDGGTRIRIWKDSTDVSVGGETARMGERTSLRGGSVIVPAGTVDYVEARVRDGRSHYVASAPRAAPRSSPPLISLPMAPAISAGPVKPTPPSASPRGSGRPSDGRWEPAGIAPRPWRWIVIHHSDDTSGNLAKYDRIHREVNGWDECGYHFVVGNGTLSGNGEVEVGSRWWKQKHGAHCKTADNCFNDFGIGICLVGDFENGGRPSRVQMDALVQLCRWLMQRYGIGLDAVVGHSDCKATACPGRMFPWSEFRSRLAGA